MADPRRFGGGFGIPEGIRRPAQSIGRTGRIRLLTNGWLMSGMTSLIVLFVMTGERSGPSSKNVRSLKAPSTPIHSLCFSPAALKIASCDTSGRLTLWELPEDRPWDEWGGGDQKIKCVAFSPNWDLMAWGTWDGRIMFWNLKTRTRTRTLHDREASISVLEFSPDGKTLVSGDVTGNLHCGMWRRGSCVRFTKHDAG